LNYQSLYFNTFERLPYQAKIGADSIYIRHYGIVDSMIDDFRTNDFPQKIPVDFQVDRKNRFERSPRAVTTLREF